MAPGPGHYYNPSQSSAIKVQVKPPRFQFFGSATERFKENINQSLKAGIAENLIAKNRNVPVKRSCWYNC